MYYPTTDDLLASMGLARRHAPPTIPAWVAPGAVLFGAGVLAGATAALLLTPKTGPELRGDMLTAAKGATDTVRSRLPALTGDAPPFPIHPTAAGTASADAK